MKFSFIKLMVAVMLLSVCVGSGIAQVRFRKGNHQCSLPPGLENKLLNAISNDRLAEVKQLLRRGVSANTKDDCQIPALIYAISMLRVDITKELIAAGADVNAIDGFSQYPPLIWAIDSLPHDNDVQEEARVYEIVRLLVEAEADVNLKGESQRTALIMAVLAKNEKIAELLLAHKANVNELDGNERTAYSYAAQAGFKRLKQMLRAAEADLKIRVKEFKQEFGENAFTQAASEGRTDVIEAMLADGYNVNQPNQAGVTALLRVLEDSTLDVLLDAGADVNKKDNAGFTALMWAAILNRESQVKKLITAGANVNARSKDGRSVLDHAASGIREILIRAGAKQ